MRAANAIQGVIGRASATNQQELPTGAYRTDIIAPGESLWNPPEENLMTRFGLNPGDAIVLPAGRYGNIDIMGYQSGIWIMSDDVGTASVNRINFGDFGENPKVIGNPNASKNLVIENSPGDHYFGLYCANTGNILYRNLLVRNCVMGIQVITEVANLAHYIRDYQNLQIYNVDMEDIEQEGVYSGFFQYSPIQITGLIRNVRTTRTGRDGIQGKNGTYQILNNTVTDTGLEGNNDHGHGIALGADGGGTHLVKDNSVTNAFTYGIFCSALGDVNIRGNTISAPNNSGFFGKNYNTDTEDPLGIGYQRFIFYGNSFTGNPKALEVVRDPVKVPMTVDLYDNNTFTGTQVIETANGIVLNNLPA